MTHATRVALLAFLASALDPGRAAAQATPLIAGGARRS